MANRLSARHARKSLNAHAAARGAEIRQKYGPEIGWNELLQILQDPDCVRYPCELCFDATPLLPGEFAHPVPKGARPEEGYTIFVHPCFTRHLARVPYLVLYQLVLVNYGQHASPDDAETFGCQALGLTKDDYYAALCRLADELAAPAAASPEGERPEPEGRGSPLH